MGAQNGILLLGIALVAVSSVALTVIAWSPAFEDLFLPCAGVIVPTRNALIAIHIAAAAAHGQLEMLMALPIILIGPFFFMGLSSRTALTSGVLTAAAFISSAVYFHLALPTALRSCTFLLLGLTACAIAARHLEKLSRTSFLETRLVAEMAQHDALTGTKNRRVFDEHLASLWPQAIAHRRSIAILLIDIDHFKAYNDRYGHQAGDQTLRRVAQTIQSLIRRPLDVLARYGGEEFAAVLYDVDDKNALEIANRIRRAVEALEIEHGGSHTSAGVTISIGVSVIEPARERDPRGALQLADQALYEAKVKGRNRIEMMKEEEYRMMVTGVFSLETLRAVER
jgi:diguanylate cyclase (GGDEF)-like protein